MSTDVFRALTALGIVPVIEIESAANAVRLAESLHQAGLSAMEVTFRTPEAARAVKEVSSAFPDFLVGAGTLLTADQVYAARDAGARFGVSPGYTQRVGAASRSSGLPLIPGASTASEVMRTLEDGFDRVKFFPAERSGGAKSVADLSAPLAKTGVMFMPTGGINVDNLSHYLEIATVFAVGGSWIAPRQIIADGDWDAITTLATTALNHVALARRKN